jgi:hypothetical protein
VFLEGPGMDVYPADDQRLMVADYGVTNGRFEAGTPKRWIDRPLADADIVATFDVTADGRRVAALPPAEEASAPGDRIIVVTDFFDLLRAYREAPPAPDRSIASTPSGTPANR